MSKVVASLPKGLIKNSVIGAVLSLLCYVMLQFLAALLINCELMGEGMVFPLVCVSAGISSFLGCGYSVLRGGSGSILSASAVVMVFLALTVAVALLSGKTGVVGADLTGVGAAMAAGGLLAALVPGFGERAGKTRRDRVKKRKPKK